MTDWFDELYTDRKEWVESTRKNQYWKGIWQSTVEKYADPTHFLYELLQNAEDQGATTVLFVLRSTYLAVSHNGAPFTREDVTNITGIGNSDKPQQANKIGRFGIGFKSVFIVTERPEIYTTLEGEPFAFAIEDLVVPVALPDPNQLAQRGWTRFVLPFEMESASELSDKILKRLRAMGADTLMFLNTLKQVRWASDTEEGTLTCERDVEKGLCRLKEEIGTKGAAILAPAVSYLLFSRVVQIANADSNGKDLTTRLAFRVEENSIVPERGQGTAYVYFPTREKTGLKFRLHAPFLLNDSRANIKDNCSENTLLIQSCAHLLVESLPILRDKGFLTAGCMECLPIREQDFDGSPFLPMFNAVRHAFKTQELLPTGDNNRKRHVKASHARISDSRPLRSLLDQKQLTDLSGSVTSDPVCWLSDKIQKTVTKDLWDYLVRHLEVEEVDSMKFARRLNVAFLSVQDDSWMIRFYDFLNDQSALWRAKSGSYDAGPLRHKPILRLESDADIIDHVAPYSENGTLNAFLPTSSATGFPIVKRSIARDEEALKFLLALGLKTPEVVDGVLRDVLPRYRSGKGAISAADNAADLTAIAEAINTARQGELHELENDLRRTPFVRASNAADKTVSYKCPDQVYRNTREVIDWFEGNNKAWILSKVVREHPSWPVIAKLFSQRSGMLATGPRVFTARKDIDGNVVIVDRKGCHSRGLNGFDPQADIDGLSHALEFMTLARARLLWQMLLASTHLVKGNIESSKYANYLNSGKAEHFSVLGEGCRNSAWLPDSTGKFHRPSALLAASLSSEFDVAHPNYRELAITLGMSYPEEEAVADQLGVPAEILAALVSAWKHNPSIMDQIKMSQSQAEFPTASSPYTERRAEKIAEEAKVAPEKTYEKRERSVRVSDTVVRSEAKSALRSLYTNLDGETVCQVCEEIMPFKDTQGDYYFEAVQCLKETGEELIQNFLALCPVCAAKYRHANSTSLATFHEAILQVEGLSVRLVLAQEPHTLRFHEHHLKDLRNALHGTPNP